MDDVASAPTLALSTLGLPIGTVFADRFEVRALLGEGGMGAVYRAHDRELQEEVALKVLRREIADTAGTLDRFRREVKLARRVTHPNVARTFDLGWHEGTRFLTMELIAGAPLSSLSGKDRRPALPEALRIVAEVARGLAAAHAVGVIHRDLKPDNIMMASSGQAGGERIVITDFGIARLADAGAQTRTLGGALGTPAYMAPEQLEGAELDGRTDIYALGIVLFELLTGELPFRGETLYALAAARLTQSPPDPRTLDATIPEGVAKLVLDAMARRREDRPDAQTVLQRIEALRGGAPAVIDRGLRLPTAGVDLVRLTQSTGPRVIAIAPLDAPDPSVGLANDLTAALGDAVASIRGVRLLPIAQVRAHRSQHASEGTLDALALGRALSADLVLDGSLRVASGKARLRLRLFEVGKGAQSWADRLEGSADDPFALEDELVRLAGEAIRPRVLHGGQSGPLEAGVRDWYERGRAAYERFGPQPVREAIAILEEGNAKHPGDPWIMSLLGSSLARAWALQGAMDASLFARAEELSIRALAADSTIGQTFHTIALLRIGQGDLRAAVRALQDALERAPLLAEAHFNLGRLLAESGHIDEGMRRLEIASRLDPRAVVTQIERARTYALLGDKQRTLEILDATRTHVGTGGVIMLESRLVLWWKDRAWALRLSQQLEQAKSGAAWDAAVPMLRAYGEDRSYDDAPAMFDRLTSPRIAPRHRALMQEVASEYFAEMGDRERAFAHLEATADLPFVDLLWLDRCPCFEGLRADPRFARIRAIAAQRVADLWS